MMEEDPRQEAARQAMEKQADRERIANREQHEGTLNAIIETLRVGGYFIPGETVTLSYPEAAMLGSRWKKQDGSWRVGMGRAVAMCETMTLVNPPINSDRAAKYPSGDHLEKAFLVAGYRVDVWPEMENITDGIDTVDYYIYEAEK